MHTPAPAPLRPFSPLSRPRLLASVLILVAGGALAGCGASSGGFRVEQKLRDAPAGGRVLTQKEIRATGARNAMEALERGRTHLVIRRAGKSRTRIMHRGVGTLYLDSEVLVTIDGARVSRPEIALRSIPAETIAYIQVLSGREAAMAWGAEAGNGVVIVRTSARR